MEIIKAAKKLVREGYVKKIGGPSKMGQLYEVLSHTVRLYTKPGRVLWECDCTNGTKYCNESPLCLHKVAVIIFESEQSINLYLNKIIEDYKRYFELKLKISPEMVLDDLEKLKQLK